MQNIPFKPLSERMLEEPFWLGLITVVVVLIIIGMGWLAKKHLPERIDKFFSVEDVERGRLVDRNASGERPANCRRTVKIILTAFSARERSLLK